MSQEPIRVVVEKQRSGGGCGAVLGVLLLIGLAVEYWYISLGLLVLVVALWLLQRSREREKARHRPGPRDPWLNEVAVALAELGLTERARNTGSQLGGIPLEGDIGLQADRFVVYVNLFAGDNQARQAELGLRAAPATREAIAQGHTAITTVGRVVYVGNGRGGVLDEFRLEEVACAVGAIALPSPLVDVSGVFGNPDPAGATATPSVSRTHATSPDALEQLRTLGDLRAAGVLTDEELDAKKAELLRRI
jgi:Short C-terminal domain